MLHWHFRRSARPCGLGFGVWGLEFGGWSLGFGVWGLGFGVCWTTLGLESECKVLLCKMVGGGVRIHPENARRSGRHGVQYVGQCVACAALTLDVWQ